jgi:hypothetical protein
MAKLIPVPKVKQHQTQWCWAACCESMTEYYKHRAKGQHELLLLVRDNRERLYQKPDKFQKKLAKTAHVSKGRELNSQAGPNDFAVLLEQILGAQVRVHYYVSGQPDQRFGRDAMKKALDEDRVFILGAEGHDRVLCGYGEVSGKSEEGLYFMDPDIANYIWLPWDTYLTKSSSLVWVKKDGWG